MGTKYFTENDVNNKRRSFYNFYKDKETGGLRAFNGLNEELTFSEIQEIRRFKKL